MTTTALQQQIDHDMTDRPNTFRDGLVNLARRLTQLKFDIAAFKLLWLSDDYLMNLSNRNSVVIEIGHTGAMSDHLLPKGS